VRVVVALIVASAGCGFQPSQGTQASSDAPIGTHDAAILDAPGHVFLDAPPKQFMDAPCGDDDDDGVCNAVDDWPCGAKPTAPANHIELTDNGGHTDFKLTNVSLGATGTLAVAAPGAALRIQLDYNAQDSACADCIDQLEIGWHPAGQRAGCIFDDDVPQQGGRQGSINTTAFTAPTAPGVYELRINIGQNYGCTYQGAHTWWGGSEPPDVVGKVCVH
jgi:hypothetical protein